MSWFEVDRGGLRQLLEGKDKSFVLRELIQNAWDEDGVTECHVTIKPIPRRPAATLTVEDNAPEGFYDLRHAYTLFANTRKRTSTKKRGRFNLGEKQVLALCEEASIITTKGQVLFRADGKRVHTRKNRTSGSRFQAILGISRSELEEAIAAVLTFIPPEGITTTINSVEIVHRTPLKTITASLATEHEDEEGSFRPTVRKAEIQIFLPLDGEKPMLYEMGLPVIETSDKYHYNIMQRVPLTVERDNVTPSFLRDVRAEVANAMVDDLTEDDVSEKWVRDAASDPRINTEAVEAIATKRWGNKRVVADPSDPMSREKAITSGFHMVSPREMSKEEWAQMRKADAVPSSSSFFPTLTCDYKDIPITEWTEDQIRVVKITRQIAKETIDRPIDISLIKAPKATTAADYGSRHLRFNVSRLGHKWFRPDNIKAQLCLIIHELGHEFGGHVDESYYRALCRIGAELILSSRTEEILKGDSNG